MEVVIMTNKKTQKEIFNEMLADSYIAENAEWAELLRYMVELIERKRTRKTKSKNAEVNGQLINEIFDFFKAKTEKIATCSEIMNALNNNRTAEEKLSQSKVTALLSKICGTVAEPLPNAPIIRIKDKRTTKFQYIG